MENRLKKYIDMICSGSIPVRNLAMSKRIDSFEICYLSKTVANGR